MGYGARVGLQWWLDGLGRGATERERERERERDEK